MSNFQQFLDQVGAAWSELDQRRNELEAELAEVAQRLSVAQGEAQRLQDEYDLALVQDDDAEAAARLIGTTRLAKDRAQALRAKLQQAQERLEALPVELLPVVAGKIADALLGLDALAGVDVEVEALLDAGVSGEGEAFGLFGGDPRAEELARKGAPRHGGIVDR